MGRLSESAEKGQAAVECAFLIPVTLLLLMLLIQPGIILYNHMVMKAAASEGCRLIATKMILLQMNRLMRMQYGGI